MEEIKSHLCLFTERIQTALRGFHDWGSVREIRLRHSLPLSLTSYSGNLFLDAKGRVCSRENALLCREEDLYELLCRFCRGEVYRHFGTLKSGFVVDEEGWRLGLCPEKDRTADFIPERLEGINLRIPRRVENASDEFLLHFRTHPLSSTLILSKPGDGKTTLIRSLAEKLSRGTSFLPAFRVAVIDERKEIFPPSFRKNAGLCDILSGYDKKSGIEIATRLFSPEVIILDEIGEKSEADAIFASCGGGSILFASAHAKSLEEAKRFSYLSELISAGIFSWCATIEKIPDHIYRAKIHFEAIP